jgi:hypothetical protein
MLLNQLSPRTQLDLPEDERWLTTQHIVDSPHFSKSPRLSRLLLYLAEQTLLDRTDLLTEHNIATTVFEREADFDPSVDTIVRSHMVRLRQRLDQYVAENEAISSIKVAVPKGDYIVRFERITPVSPEGHALPEPTTIPPAPTEQQSYPASGDRNRLALICWLMGVVILVLLATLLAVLNHANRKPPEAAVAAHPLWSEMFTADQQTTLVLADSNLVVWQGLMKQDIGLAQYLSGDYRTTVPSSATPLQRDALQVARGRYTSMIDVEMVQYFSQISHLERSKHDVRYTRDLRPNDLKQGNVILSGAPEANPWVQLFEHDMNFVFSYDRAHQRTSVLNRVPQGSEPRQWDSMITDKQHHVYGVVAYLPNLSGNGNVLILEGTSIAGTECALDFVSDDSQLLPFLKQLRHADGRLPHFEVVLGTNNMGGSAVKNSILAWRTKN